MQQLSSEPAQSVEIKHHFKGCNCRRTKCQKNYCECFQAGVPCTSLCQCTDCHNPANAPKGNHKGNGKGAILVDQKSSQKENVKGSENQSFPKRSNAQDRQPLGMQQPAILQQKREVKLYDQIE